MSTTRTAPSLPRPPHAITTPRYRAPRSAPRRPLSLYQRVYVQVDRLSGGRGAQVRKVLSYLMVGGFAACVNLAVQALLLYGVALPMSESAHNLLALVIATECSILANFVPNDRFTFRPAEGHWRPWQARCLRFHLTALSGTLLAMLLQIILHEALHIQPVLANAIALVLVLNYNYVTHHLFTYRQAAAH